MSTDPRGSFRALLPVLRPQWHRMGLGVLVGTASALALGALQVLTAWAVGRAVVEHAPPPAAWWVGTSLLVLLRAALTWQEMDLSHGLAFRVLTRLRGALFDGFARSIPARRREHSGQVAAVAMDDTERLEFFYAHTVGQLVTAVVVAGTCLVAACMLLPPAAWAMVVGILLIALTGGVGRRAVRRLGVQEQQLHDDLSVRVVDALGSLREVLAYGLVPRVVEDSTELTDRATAVARRRELAEQFVTGLRELTVAGAVIAVLAASAPAATLPAGSPGALSPALLPVVLAVALVGLSAATDASNTLARLHPLAASAARVVADTERPAVVAPPSRTRRLPDGPLGLRLEGVSFAYDDGDRPPRRLVGGGPAR
ncbi:ABC transporter transmembrane domain-containing protein [Kytococcus sp. Marseille-QA3725]